MLMNRLELTKRYAKDIGEFGYIMVEHRVPKGAHTPMMYEGIYTICGSYTIWNDVGGVSDCGACYKPVNGGSVLYEVH